MPPKWNANRSGTVTHYPLGLGHLRTKHEANRVGCLFAPAKSVKRAELETLIACKEDIGSDRPEGDFYARALRKSAWDKPWMKAVEKVILVHRLREVMAQLGFTRFESIVPDVEGELE